MAIIASFLQYIIIMIILIAVACLGWTLGKKLRLNKDAKTADSTAVTETTQDGGCQDK